MTSAISERSSSALKALYPFPNDRMNGRIGDDPQMGDVFQQCNVCFGESGNDRLEPVCEKRLIRRSCGYEKGPGDSPEVFLLDLH